MADIILPDDVFENMQHAQEAAEKMDAAVTDFNKKVDEKFKGKDNNENAKVQQKVKPILNADEKRRYRNIGNTFFEGAKTQIVDIFKQIEKNKKKSSFKHAAASINEKIKEIKETAEEKNTGKKILLAIAAIGGIYMLFKDWFDKNMPGIWEKMKEAVVSFANSAVSLAKEISKTVANSDIFQTIKNFVLDTGKTIATFFEDIGKTLTGLFSGTSDSKNKSSSYSVEEKTKKDIENEKEKANNNIIYSTIIQNPDKKDAFNDLKENQKQRLAFAQRIDEIQKMIDKGIAKFNGNDILDELKHAKEKLGKLEAAGKDIVSEATYRSEHLAAEMASFAKNSSNTPFGKHVANLIKDGHVEAAVSAFLKSNHAKQAIESYDGPKKYFDNSFMFNNVSSDSYLRGDGVYAARQTAEAMTKYFVKEFNNGQKNNGETIKETETEQKKAEDKLRKQQEESKRRIQNANYAKLTHVSVITSLDEFVRNFFDGDKPGSFKSFSKTFLESIKQIADNFKIGVTVAKHINSLHNKVNSLIDKVDENFEVIVETLNNDTTSIKDFINKKFKEEGLSVLKYYVETIIDKEQEQVNCLVEQNKLIKETNDLLSTINFGNKSININSNPTNVESLDITERPSLFDINTANAFVSGGTIDI